MYSMNEINDNNYMQWVERFLDAETTLNQERELYAYFSRSNLPEGARRYREMFGWYEDMQTPTPASSQSSPIKLLPLRMWQWVSVAAIIVLLFAAGLMLRPSATGNEYIGDDGYIYSGYMIRDGKKITDMAIVSAEMDRINDEIDRYLIDIDNYIDAYSAQLYDDVLSPSDSDSHKSNDIIEASFTL